MSQSVTLALDRLYLRFSCATKKAAHQIQLPDFGLALSVTACWYMFIWCALSIIPHKTRDILIYWSALVPLPLVILKSFQIPLLRRLKIAYILLPTLLFAALRVQDQQRWFIYLVFTLLQVFTLRRFGGAEKKPIKPSEVAFLFCIWSISGSLYWQGSWAELFTKHGAYPYLTAFGIFFMLVCPFRNSSKPHAATMYKVVIYLALGFLVLPHLFYISARDSVNFSHHWGFYTGPADLIRQGAIPLREVPSQYGLLNIILISLAPFRNSFENLLWIQAILYCIIASIFLSVCLRVFSKTVSGGITSLLLILACLFYLPGWVTDQSGPIALPSIGPFRFVFVYILVWWLLKITERMERLGKFRSWEFIMGHVLWLLSVLWSFESGVYCTSIWFVAFPCILMGRFRMLSRKQFFLLVGTPVLLVAAVCTIAVLYYQTTFHCWPDLLAFVEFPFAYARGYGFVNSNPHGPVWILIGTSTFLLFSSFLLFRKDCRHWFPLSLSLFTLFWNLSSYFATRSHDNNVSNLAPLSMFLLLVCVYIIQRAIKEARGLIYFLIPLIFVCCVQVFADYRFPASFKERVSYLKNSPSKIHVLSIHQRLADDELKALKKLGATKDDRIVYLGRTLFVWPDENGTPAYVQRFLFPMAPFAQFSILGKHRQLEYLERWLRLSPIGTHGYIVLNDKDLNGDQIKEFVLNHIQVLREIRNGELLVQEVVVK